MDFKNRLESLIRTKVEVKDNKNINVEYYDNVGNWENHMYTFVNKFEPHTITENVKTLSVSILDIDDKETIEKFKKGEIRPSYFFNSFPRIKYLIESSKNPLVFVEGIGLLNEEELDQLKIWLG